MMSPYNLESDVGLKTFGNIAVDIANTNFGSFAKQPPAVALFGAAQGSMGDILAEYPDGVVIQATESKTGLETGLVFHTKDITALADLMTAGDGEPKAELDNDLKDASKELANQFFGAFVVPVETQLGKKLQFNVDNISKAPADTQSDTFIIYDFAGTLNGAFQYRMYVDESFSQILGGQGGSGTDSFATDFFSAPVSERPSSGPTSPNMEMLLDVEIPVSVRMGSAKLFLKDVLGLGPGNIVELDQNADEPIELTVNDKLIARGEVVIVDGYFGFRIKEIISKAERIKRLKD